MLFNSLSFLVFFPICLLVFFIVPKKARAYWLLLCSFFFYMCWNAAYVLLLLLSIGVTYSAGILIEKFDELFQKKIVVAASLVINFSILFLYKYLDFFTGTINKFLYKTAGMQIPALNLILPVGISFYIFQAAGYTIDVYRGNKAEKNLVKYALFVSFFPQLVAGPIERSGNLLKQIRELDSKKYFDIDNILRGSLLMLYGFFMKLMIADRASILVATVFNEESFTYYKGFEVLLAAVLFSVQIYCDFAGYTYIAIGAARVMGFTLCENFNAPYLSMGIKDFWNRWHISLSTWFRDYLYFPLGGSKKGSVRKYINIFIVFFVSGLWHGASWHFVVWGVLHGVLRIVEEITEKPLQNLSDKIGYRRDTFSHRGLRIVTNFLLVTLCWVFFRAQSTSQAIILIKNMFSGLGLWQLTDDSLLNLGLDGKEMTVLFLAILLMIIVDYMKMKKKDILSAFMRQNTWFQFLLFLTGIITIVIFGVYGPEYDATTFIYFQF